MKLKQYLEQYKEMTKTLIDNVHDENKLNELLKNRQKLIDQINSMNYTADDFENADIKKEILQLDKNLHDLIDKEKSGVIEKIKSLKQRNNAAMKYYNANVLPSSFNKKI